MYYFYTILANKIRRYVGKTRLAFLKFELNLLIPVTCICKLTTDCSFAQKNCVPLRFNHIFRDIIHGNFLTTNITVTS
ncbi:hypothetical protein SAMN06264855_10316 [Halorubrum vacuolatum]|uniref:Uncharacterized protein n=1 Tax=Halorubrum vacuolatum TaxID=63740 RepID=A0A238VK42_HALVU|nr:hypothetical protein SAMN06264855_10316 [Halorubrum vacuolatum]